MDDAMKEFVEGMLGSMPEEMRETIRKAVCARSDKIIGDPAKREEMRARVIADGDEDTIKGFESACNLYDTNLQVVQLLGNIKTMLSKWDETDLSSANIKENTTLLKHVHMTIAISMEGIADHMRQVIEAEENQNETGDGETPS